ncbi:MAG TPA: ABC transporter substrate-binding protein [Vicinamibacteria bacterium]|nr:ABC transporter substrate-binding protein [Vicinamibacteria bacterium]
MRANARFASVVSLALATAAGAAPAAGPAESPLVIYHWWGSSSETKALGELVRVFEARYPGVPEKRTFAPDRGGTLFTILQRLTVAGNPPDAIVMQTGYFMRPFIDEKLLGTVDDLWASEGLEKAVPPSLRTMHRFDGHYYSIPIDVQRTNLIWYNKPLLERHGIDPATFTTWDRFFEAAARLRAAGVTTPVQLAAGWTVAQLFESIMASLGIAAYQDWVNGRMRSAADPRLVEALAVLKKYSGFVNKDHAGLDWTVALGRVARGESAFYAMGDWANGDFRAAGLVYGRDYSAFVAPGTKGLYGVTIDAFVQPRGLVRPANSTRWLKVVASREGQDAFNVPKGSIPARTDPAAPGYDAYQRSAIAAFRQSVIYPTFGGAMPGVYVREMEAALEAFVDHGDARRAAAALANAAVASQASFTRAWSLD